MKKNIRFLKKITILCVVMNTIITFTTLAICLLQREINAGILSALLGAWSIELGLSAFIKNSEKPQEEIQITEEEDIEEKEDNPLDGSI